MPGLGTRALDAAGRKADPTVRRLWLVAAVQAIVDRPLVLVGGSAVDLYTGSYEPTDIDLVGAIGATERAALADAGFVSTGGRHLRWVFPDGTAELIEFPASTLDGTYERVQLSDDVAIDVITLESLVVDRVHQATDGTVVTFDEAVRLAIGAGRDVDWKAVSEDLARRPEAIYLGSVDRARGILLAAGMGDVAARYF